MTKRDAGLGAGLHIDRIIADAEAGDDAEPAALRDALPPEAMGQQDQRVEILQLSRANRAWRIRGTPSRPRARS